MKIKSLLLGSVAAAGLSTGAFAADLGVLPSFDVCDELGMSGLTISSDENCLAISGGVTYKFAWGDYSTDGLPTGGEVEVLTSADTLDIITENGDTDWDSRVDAWLQFVGAAPTDMGPAKAVIKLKATDQKIYRNAGEDAITDPEFVPGTDAGSTTDGFVLDQAYVQIGDASSFTLIAGKADSIYADGDDEPLNFLGLFNSEAVDAGVGGNGGVDIETGGHVMQALVSVGDGVTIGGALEALNFSEPDKAGTAVGVVSYAGDGISAHASFAADGVLIGSIDDWMVNAGFDGTFDNFRVVAAAYFDSSSYWNVLASASATFDIFTLAGSVEATEDGDYGAGVSIAAAIVDDVVLSLGARYYYEDTGNDDSYEIAAKIEAPVTETLTVAGTVGYINSDYSASDALYGVAELAWAPGGGFTATSAARVTSEGAYKLSTEITKEFN
ncbi:hypothetical protein [Devosia sp.]|uniref:hypothetical protein n=1 Tax=Devosia sp. TaxID=1871048 RepID=UPI003A8DD11A